MKKLLKIIIAVGASITTCLLTSCATMKDLFYAPHFSEAEKVLAPDLTEYTDYAVEKCKLPDGKIVTVYVFLNPGDQLRWQNKQSQKFDKELQKEHEKKIAREESYKKGLTGPSAVLFKSSVDDRIASYRWYPTGPLTPFWKAYFGLVDKYGKDVSTKKIIDLTEPISYYTKEDLGQLSQYMTTDNAVAQACYEDSNGIYLLTIAKPQYMEKMISIDMRIKHKDEFAYQVNFIPKEWYKSQPLKLNPAKTRPYDSSQVPDSDRDFAPIISSGDGAYYYDKKLADSLQWLAVKIACKGVYEMAYTGNSNMKNPKDYYNTSMIKKYLASNDGKASRGTTLFEGLCFDYADFAYQELKDNRKDYPNVANFWMVGTFEDSSTIVQYRIANANESPNSTINRTPVVIDKYSHTRAHDNATNHAWFWVQGTDGVIYWVDPTWTDNTGRPVYGIVRNGLETPLEPDQSMFAR